MDSNLRAARRELEADPNNYCLANLVSKLEARAGIKGKPIFLCHLSEWDDGIVEAWEYKKELSHRSYTRSYVGSLSEVSRHDTRIFPVADWINSSKIALKIIEDKHGVLPW